MRNAAKRIGKRIKEARKDAGYTQEVLAARLGISVPSMHRKEVGSETLSAEQLAKLARLFELSADFFLQDVQ